VALFWLSYRHRDGSFAGAVMIESNALIYARMRVALSGADKGLAFISGDVLDPDSVGEMPSDLLGSLLDQSDLRKLERLLLKKKPPERSVRRPKSPSQLRDSR
jgi:hypothetical protein